MVDRALHTSNTDEWATPQHLFDFLNNNNPAPFTLDPCATSENAKCERYYTIEDDGLNKPWFGNVFVNPPFSNVDKWVSKAVYECRRSDTLVKNIVLLIGVRTDTMYWRDYIWTGPVWAITFIRGRLKFGGASNSAPFPSCIIWMEPRINKSNELIRPIIEVLEHDKKWNWYYI